MWGDQFSADGSEENLEVLLSTSFQQIFPNPARANNKYSLQQMDACSGWPTVLYTKRLKNRQAGTMAVVGVEIEPKQGSLNYTWTLKLPIKMGYHQP